MLLYDNVRSEGVHIGKCFIEFFIAGLAITDFIPLVTDIIKNRNIVKSNRRGFQDGAEL